MEDELNIRFDWLDHEWGDEVERVTYASLQIEAGGEIVTQVEDKRAKTVRDHVRVSAYHLAQWFAANWWRLRWEPSASSRSWLLSHCVGAAGGGYVWPDVTFASDQETVLVEFRATPRTDVEPIRYLNSSSARVDADKFERVVSEFVEAVLARLAAVEANGAELRTLWGELQKEQEDPSVAKWRKLEALAGFDPDEGPEALLEELQGFGQEVGERAMEEVVSASKSEATSHLHWLWTEARSRATDAKIVYLTEPNDRELDAESGPPWKRGEVLAKSVRKEWGIRRGPILNEQLSDLVQISPAFLAGEEGRTEAPMPAAFRNGGNGSLGLVINKGHPNSRRFAVARLLADHLGADPEDRLLPATDAATARQKFQRAFAQEFLCPYDDLQEYFNGAAVSEEEIEEAAAHFEVSSLLIATKLVNKGVLDRSALADWSF